MKELIKTKTFWAGIGLVGYGITLILTGNPEDGIRTILEGIAVIFLRDAIRRK